MTRARASRAAHLDRVDLLQLRHEVRDVVAHALAALRRAGRDLREVLWQAPAEEVKDAREHLVHLLRRQHLVQHGVQCRRALGELAQLGGGLHRVEVHILERAARPLRELVQDADELGEDYERGRGRKEKVCGGRQREV